MIMHITVDGVSHDFDPDKVRNDEAMAIERALGVTYKAWTEQITAGSVSALTALVWLVQRRDNPGLKFENVRFEIGGLDVSGDPEADGENPTDGEAASTNSGTAT